MLQNKNVRLFKEETRTIYSPKEKEPSFTPTINKEPLSPSTDYISVKNPTGNNTTIVTPIDTNIPHKKAEQIIPPNETADQINVNIPSKTIDQINEHIPDKTADQIADQIAIDSACQSILSVWRRLFPTIPDGLGQLSSFNPPNLSNKTCDTNFTVLDTHGLARLMRTLYLKVLRALDTYSLLIRTTSNNEQSTLVNLRTQMQVLSAVVLNIYGDYTRGNFVPLRVDINSTLPRDTARAFLYLYNEIYCIYYLSEKLLFNFDATSPFYNQILAFINNIKYQLNVIYTLGGLNG